VCRDRKPSQTSHVVDHIPRLAAEWVRRLRQPERDDVAVAGADFDGVDAEHPGDVPRGIRFPGCIAVVGQYDEVESRTRG
jgi:hypothetical protein